MNDRKTAGRSSIGKGAQTGTCIDIRMAMANFLGVLIAIHATIWESRSRV